MIRSKRAQKWKEFSASTKQHCIKKSKLEVPAAVLKRCWNEMHHDILVSIMKLASYEDKGKHLYKVCNSWRDAVIDSLSPPGDVLDLQFIDQPPISYSFPLVYIYSKFVAEVVARRPYTKLIISKIPFWEKESKEIAKRLRELKCVVIPTSDLSNLCHRITMMSYWSELVEVHCRPILVGCVVYCKKVRKLYIDDPDHDSGFITNDVASAIAHDLPQLEHLALRRCFLTSMALSMILDGQKELKHLDTRHAVRFDDDFITPLLKDMPFGKSIGWNGDEILTKVTGINTYLECSRENCLECRIYYHYSDIM